MYEWFLENFNKDKKEMIDNKLEYMYCTFDSIDKKISILEKINLGLLEEEDCNDVKYFYSLLISKKNEYENPYEYYNKLISWYSLNLDTIMGIIVNLEKRRIVDVGLNNRFMKEVECPYCYAIYDIDKCGISFMCEGCESSLEVEFDENGEPYIENN